MQTVSQRQNCLGHCPVSQNRCIMCLREHASVGMNVQCGDSVSISKYVCIESIILM